LYQSAGTEGVFTVVVVVVAGVVGVVMVFAGALDVADAQPFCSDAGVGTGET
jgi:uncharacterized membrane protein YqiK